MTEELKDGTLINKVYIIAELEDGQAIVACPTKIGEIDKEDSTINDITVKLEPDSYKDDPKLASPIIFVEDLKALVDKWILELRDYRDTDIIKFLEEKFK